MWVRIQGDESINVRCDFCGIMVEKKKSELIRAKNHFCSNSCKTRYKFNHGAYDKMYSPEFSKITELAKLKERLSE